MEYDIAFVISLDRSSKRWDKISSLFNAIGLPYQKFKAIDGYEAQLTNSQTGQIFTGYDIKTKSITMDSEIVYKITCDPKVPQETFNLTGGGKDVFNAGEIGVLCSHMTLWKLAAKTNYNRIVVFEDDFSAKPDDFIEKLNHFIKDLPISFDLAYIDAWHSKGTKIPLANDLKHISYFSKDSVWMGMWAYIFSNKFAQKIVTVDPYIRSIDQYLFAQAKAQPNKFLEVYVSSFNLSATSPESLSGLSPNSVTSEMGCRQYHENNSLDCHTNLIPIHPEF